VLGDLDVGMTTVDGDLSVGGAIRCDTLEIRGRLEVAGPIEVRGAWSDVGEVRAAGAVRAGEIAHRGSFHGRGAVAVERRARFEGDVSVPSLRAGSVRLGGSLQLPGTLEAFVVQLDLRGSSAIGSIQGERVEVTGRVPNPVEEILLKGVEVHLERIEANEVEITGARVGFVHAERVLLGRGAHVTTVEGTIVRQHRTARVGPESWSPPPFGLRR